jgi:hypothetical protein
MKINLKKKLHNNLVDSIIILTFVMSKGLSRKKQESRLRPILYFFLTIQKNPFNKGF